MGGCITLLFNMKHTIADDLDRFYYMDPIIQYTNILHIIALEN